MYFVRHRQGHRGYDNYFLAKLQARQGLSLWG